MLTLLMTMIIVVASIDLVSRVDLNIAGGDIFVFDAIGVSG